MYWSETPGKNTTQSDSTVVSTAAAAITATTIATVASTATTATTVTAANFFGHGVGAELVRRSEVRFVFCAHFPPCAGWLWQADFSDPFSGASRLLLVS